VFGSLRTGVFVVLAALALASCAPSRSASMPDEWRPRARMERGRASPFVGPDLKTPGSEGRDSAPANTMIETSRAAAPGDASSRSEAARTPAEKSVANGLVTLPVPGLESAFVSFPRTTRFPSPVLVAAHGAGDTPEALCETFRRLLGDRGVVLCPSGPRMFAHSEGRYFPNHPALERIVLASLDALVATYPRETDGKDVAYAGYSQGATMGALMIVAHGDRFPRLLLIEGGGKDWTLARARQFRAAGGGKVLFVCGTTSCRTHAKGSASLLDAAGVATSVVSDVRAGHTYEGPVLDLLAKSIDEFLSDDPRWSSPHP
jgi:predicted esterase